MIVYLVCFFISIIFVYYSEKTKKKTNKIITIGIAIILPAILAGLRGYNIGTDVSVYCKVYFDLALKSRNVIKYLTTYKSVEYGYLLLTYITAHLSHSFNCFLFIVQVIINGGIFYYINSKEDGVPNYIRWMAYLFFFFNVTLNIIRQSISLAIFLVSMVYVEKKKYKTGILILLLSLLFHNSILFTLPIVLLFWGFNLSNKKKSYKFVFFLIAIALLIFVVLLSNYERIMNLLVYRYHFLPEKYNYYVENSSIGKIGDRSFIFLVLLRSSIYIFPIICCVMTMYRRKKETVNNSLLFIILLMIDLIIYLFKYKMNNIDRIGYYYSVLGFISIYPSIYNIIKRDKYNLILMNILLFGILFIFWYINFIHYNMNETYPYYMELYK